MQQVKDRITTLIARLEAIDVAMVGNLHEEIGKKRSSKLYFKAQGKISAYRCIVKGFPCERVVDYMGIIICKLRIQQILGLIAYQDEFDSQFRFVPDGKLYSSTF